jgi:hypothetical protein
MKKLILIIIIALIVQQTNAQPEKGKKLIGGGIGGSIKSNPYSGLNVNTNYHENLFVAAPQFGYFLSDKFAAGFSLNYNYFVLSRYNIDNLIDYTENNSKEINNTIGGGLFTRHYKIITDKFYFTFSCELGYNYTFQKSISEYVFYAGNTLQSVSRLSKSRGNLFHFAIGPGFEYFISPHIGLRASFGSFGYNYSSINNANSNSNIKSSNLDFNFNQSTLLFGMNYIFQKKAK